MTEEKDKAQAPVKDTPEGAAGLESENPECIELPVDGVLDLHTFQPREVKDLLPHYLDECRKRGILEVRVIHGKGTGILRETVRSILMRLPEVASFRQAGGEEGGWGATIVSLKQMKEKRPIP